MGTTWTLRHIAFIGFGLAFPSLAARANYTATVIDHGSGAGSVAVDQGDPVNLDVVLTSGADDRLDSFYTELGFSRYGLLYDSYSLASPEFETGGIFDFSDQPGGPIEGPIVFEALTESSEITFGTGTLISLWLIVPGDYLPGDVLINVPGDGCLPPFWWAGPNFRLTVVPEPGSLCLLAIGGIVVLRRRRRA